MLCGAQTTWIAVFDPGFFDGDLPVNHSMADQLLSVAKSNRFEIYNSTSA
jgi:hypothetical protein